MANCVNCASGMHEWFCLWHDDGGCKENESSETFGAELSIAVRPEEEKEEKTLKDPVSAGRKRAAVMYPIVTGQVCEWAWMKNCGGMPIRIMGCTGRPATNLHHGPNKSTLANDKDNISIICTYCHNRLHSANDKFYIEPRPADNSDWMPDPALVEKFGGGPVGRLDEMVKATKQEILINEMTIPEGGKDAKRSSVTK